MGWLFGAKEFHAVGVCMDENENLSQKDKKGRIQYAMGMVASGITNTGSGNQRLYPDSKRMLVANVAPVAWAINSEISREKGGIFSLTSHKYCGGAKAQGLSDSDAAFSTRALAGRSGVNYAGQVDYATNPEQIGRSDVLAHMSRKPSDHHHQASRFVLTVGLGVSANELRDFEHPEMGGHGDAFLTSMDWVARAIERKRLEPSQIISFLALTLDIADGIADNNISVNSVRILDAGRLDGKEARLNKRIVEDSIGSIRQLF